MSDINELIKNFFAAYEARFDDALKGRENVDATVNSFVSCFLEAMDDDVHAFVLQVAISGPLHNYSCSMMKLIELPLLPQPKHL